MPYQAQTKGDAMQGLFVQESKKKKYLADAVLLKEKYYKFYLFYIHNCKSMQTVPGPGIQLKYTSVTTNNIPHF